MGLMRHMRLGKLFFASLLVSGSITSFSAQTPGNNDTPPGITIRKYKWQQVGPGPSVEQSWKAESDTASLGGSSDESPTAAGTGRTFFVYSLELVNGGSKPIKAVRWEYIISDSKSGAELGNHDLENFEYVGTNKAKSLTAKSRVSPTKVVPVQVTDQAPSTEKVVLRCVLYQDGSLWRNRDTPAPECEALRRRAED